LSHLDIDRRAAKVELASFQHPGPKSAWAKVLRLYLLRAKDKLQAEGSLSKSSQPRHSALPVIISIFMTFYFLSWLDTLTIASMTLSEAEEAKRSNPLWRD
jgi:hypothetical protein